MKILHVIHQYGPETTGGSENYLADLVREQRRQGHTPVVLTGSMVPWERPGVERGEFEGMQVLRVHRSDLFFDHHIKAWNPDVEAIFAQALADEAPDLVHVHHWIRLTSTLVRTAARAGLPTAVTLHDYYTSCPRAFRMRPGHGACRLEVGGRHCADCVPRYGHESGDELREGVEVFADDYRDELELAGCLVVGVGATADLLSAMLGVERERFSVLPMGYARRFGDVSALDPHPRPGEPFRIAYWGGVARHKGVDDLVAAFSELRRADVELHILGGFESPAFEAELREFAEDSGAQFHGAFEAGKLRAIAPHLGVFPATSMETFGIVLDECNELGLPAIVSDRGALPERIGGGGLVVPAGDRSALAAALARIIDEPPLRDQLVAGRPELPPSMAEHARALDQVYGALPRPDLTGWSPRVPIARRLRLMAMQRETALGRAAQGPPT